MGLHNFGHSPQYRMKYRTFIIINIYIYIYIYLDLQSRRLDISQKDKHNHNTGVHRSKQSLFLTVGNKVYTVLSGTWVSNFWKT